MKEWIASDLYQKRMIYVKIYKESPYNFDTNHLQPGIITKIEMNSKKKIRWKLKGDSNLRIPWITAENIKG